MTEISSNTYNPIYIGGQYFVGYAEWATSTFADVTFSGGYELSESPDSDVWYDTFGESYEVFWRQFIYTASPWVEWIKYILENYNPMTIATEHYVALLRMWVGFDLACPGVQAGMQGKLIALSMLIPQWISYIVLIIIRLISLIIFAIFFFLYFIIDLIWDIYVQIHVAIYEGIWLPIYEIIQPLFDLIAEIKAFIVFLLNLIPTLLIWLGWFIADLFWQIHWWILSIFMQIYDWFWNIYWIILEFIWNILWIIIEILLFIPRWIIEMWYKLMEIIIPPLDELCVDIFEWLEVNIVDPILDALQSPEWTPSIFELALSVPIIAGPILASA